MHLLVFLGNLENNYQKVIKLYNSKNYQGAMKEINKFITYGKDDYKDIKQFTTVQNKSKIAFLDR